MEQQTRQLSKGSWIQIGATLLILISSFLPWVGIDSITLPAGASVEGAVVARGFSQTAKAITCIMGCESDTRYFEDSYLRFYDVPVKR